MAPKDKTVWFDRFNPWKTKAKHKDVQASVIKSLNLGFLGGATQTSSPKEVLDAFEKSPDFKRVVSVIATAVGKCEPHVLNAGKIDEKHELQGILDRPNEFMTSQGFLAVCQRYLDLVGEFYIYIPKTSMGYELYPLPPTAVSFKGDKMLVEFMGRTLDDKILGKDIVHIINGSCDNPYLTPSSWGSTLSQEIEISEYAATHEASYLKNSARKQTMLQMTGVSDEALDAFRMSWNNSAGPDQSGKLLVTNAEQINSIPLENDWDADGLLALRRHSSEAIREAYGVPPEILGNVDNSNRATIGAAEYLFATNVVQPRIDNLLAALTLKIVPIIYPEEDIVIDAPSVIPVDAEFILEIAKTRPEAFSEDEIRGLAGFAPRSGSADKKKSVVNYRQKVHSHTPQIGGFLENIDIMKALTQHKGKDD